MKRAEYHIMSQAGGVNTEPLKWPIAPDGYIPNSVIRSWRRKGKELNEADCWHDFHSLHRVDGCTPNDDEEEDVSTRTFWFIQDEEEEEVEGEEGEKTDGVRRKKKGKEDEKNEKDKEEAMKVEGKERADEKKEKEEDKMDGTVFVKQSYDIQTKTTLQNHLKTFDDEKMNVEPQRQEVGSTCSSRETVNFTPTACHENGSKRLRELREDMKPHETITPPLQYLPVPNKQKTSTFIRKEWSEPPVEGPVVSADTIIPKQEPRIMSYIPSIELKKLTPDPLKPPSTTPEDPQPQPDLGPPECSPIRDKSFLLSSTKYSNIRDQAQVPLDRKVLELFKKFKGGNKNLSHPRKLSTTAKCSVAYKDTHSSVLTNTGGLGSPLEFTISLQGFCSPRAPRLAATDHLVKSSDVRQLAATTPSLQPGPAAAHQRVVQKIQMKDTLEPAPCHFHYVIPKASQHSFCTLNLCGKTQYGRLQFDWMRGSEEDKLLEVSAVKTKDTAHKVVDENRALYHLNRSA